MAKLPKKPKQPKRSASLRSWENFDQRVHNWKQKVNAIHAAKKKKEGLINKYQRGAASMLRVA